MYQLSVTSLLIVCCYCLCFLSTFEANQNSSRLIRFKRNLDDDLLNTVGKIESTSIKKEAIKALIQKGANINARNQKGNTPLHIAASYHDIEIVKLLISLGADTRITNNDKKKPADLAKSREIITILNSKKRPPDRTDPEPNKKPKIMDIEPSTSGEQIYDKAGLTSAQHGVEYQKKLLALFYLRGMKSNYNFQMATEMVAAEKFDDIVFKYKESDSDNYYIRFVQAKHKLDEDKKIKFSDLTTNDVNGDFSLRKYFDSFRKIRQNEIFKNDYLKDFVLTTNIDIDSDIKQLFKQSTENDLLFENKHDSKIYKLSEESKSEFVPIFKETSDLHQLAKLFAQLTYYNSDIDLKNSLIKRYHINLVYENIIDVDMKKLHVNFINNNGLSKSAQDFREIFVKEFKGQNLMDVKLKLSKTFDKFKKTLEDKKKCAEWLAKLIVGNEEKKIVIEYIPSNHLRYIKEMTDHVFVEGNSANKFTFNSNFVHSQKIPENVKEFRSLLDAELKRKGFNFQEIGRLKLSIIDYKLPNDVISSVEINKFYEQFKIAVKQPNEKKLYRIIKKEIPETFQHRGNLRDNILVQLGDWMIDRQGTFLTQETITQYTKQLKEQQIFFEVKLPIESFAGRQEELKKLKSLIRKLKEGANWRSTLLVVDGFKGIGKTELVKKYISENANYFDKNIIWIDGQSIEKSLYKLAEDIKIVSVNEDGKKKPVEDIINEVYEHFVENKKRGLFIFDNVDNFESIKKYLPSKVTDIEKLKINFLVTSSNKEWDNARKISLNVFKPEESEGFIKNSLKEHFDVDLMDSKNLASKMSNFPLALEQSTAYIKEYNKIFIEMGKTFTIKDYLLRFETKAKELLSYGYSKYSTVSYNENVLTNVALTLDAIKEKGIEGVDIANTIAYLDPRDVSVELFLKNENTEKVAKMIKYLKDYSLIHSGKNGNTFYMHELTQEILRIQQKEGGTEIATIENTLNLLKENTPTERVNHIVNIWKYVRQADSLKKEYLPLMKDAMKSLIDEGRYIEVESFGNKMLQDIQGHSLETKYRTEIERHQSYALVESGQYSKALGITKNLYETAKKHDKTHFETLELYADYGTVLLKRKKFEESLEVFDFIIKNIKNDKKEFIAFVKNNKAIALLQKGKANEAIALLNEIQRDNSGKKLDKLAFAISDNKAFALYKNGEMKESIKEYNSLIEKCEKTYGELHPITQKTINNVGIVHRASGESTTALEYFTLTHDYFQSKFGSEHPLTLKSQLCIANVNADLKNNQEALDIYNKVYEIQKKTKVHNSIKLKTEYLKAVLLRDTNPDKAAKIYENIVAKSEKIFGHSHPITQQLTEELNKIHDTQVSEFKSNRCSISSRKRRNAIKCFDSTKEEMSKEKHKTQVKEFFKNTKIHGMEYNELYMYLSVASEQLAENDVLNPKLQKLLEKQLKTVKLEFVDPAIKPIVQELKKNINNKAKFKHVLKTGATKVIKATEKLNKAFILLTVGQHLRDGDVNGLAFDALNVVILPRVSQFTTSTLLRYGTKFNSVAIKAAAPIIGASVGNIFAVYQLVESIRERKHAHTLAEKQLNDLNIITNSLTIAADIPYLVGTALSSLGFSVGGFTAVAGPVGLLVGTFLLIGGHFLQAKFQVDKINEELELIGNERSKLYWRFVSFQDIPEYILDDIQAKKMFRNYTEEVLDNFMNDYDTVIMALPCFKNGIPDFYYTSNIIYPFIKRGAISRILPKDLNNYEAVCAPAYNDVIKSQNTLCLKDYPSECQNAFILKNKIHRGFGSAFHMPAWAMINISSSEKVNNLFVVKNLVSSVIQNKSNNTFILMDSYFNCNLGDGEQNNVIIVQNSANIVASNVKAIQCNNKKNKISFDNADYVDCNGGKDFIYSKKYSTIKSYLGDTIDGEGLVLLPMKMKEISRMYIDVKNFTNVFSSLNSIESIKIHKNMNMLTSDGYLVHTLRSSNVSTVTHLQILKRMPRGANMEQAMEELKEAYNPSFELSKQAINEEFQIVLGDTMNHIFHVGDSEFQKVYWEAPANVNHLYLVEKYPIHLTIGKANGLLDFSLLNTTMEDMLITRLWRTFRFQYGNLTVVLKSDYKNISLTFDGDKFYKINNRKIERDYCMRDLKINNTIQMNITDLDYYNCFVFDSEKAIFVKIDNSLWIMTDNNVLSILDYYAESSNLREFTVKLKNKMLTPDEVNERVSNHHTFVIYKTEDEPVEIFHNQPINNYQIGILNLTNNSILDFDLKLDKTDNNLVLLRKNSTAAILENWGVRPEAREMVFSFEDVFLYIPNCILTSCAHDEILNAFDKEKKMLQKPKSNMFKLKM